MPGLLPDIDPEGLLEFSVVFTDRSLNHMSGRFQGAMRDISALLKQVYHAEAVAVVPGGGGSPMPGVHSTRMRRSPASTTVKALCSVCHVGEVISTVLPTIMPMIPVCRTGEETSSLGSAAVCMRTLYQWPLGRI